jgi:hypothetical protein
MADAPDITHGGRYPSMAGWAAEGERPADPKDAGRYPSMPNGRVADKRLVPRHPPADEPAAPAGQPEADQALRARYPTMFEADVRPTEADPAPAPAAEGDQAAAPPAPQDDAAGESGEAPSLPEPYRDLPAPEGLEVDTAALATVAPDLQRLGVTREQATGLVAVLAKLEAQADAAVTAAQAAWRQEAAALPAATLADARSALKGAPAELLRVIEASRIGDHPAVIRWFSRLRSGSGAPADDAETRARQRYPNTRWS